MLTTLAGNVGVLVSHSMASPHTVKVLSVSHELGAATNEANSISHQESKSPGTQQQILLPSWVPDRDDPVCICAAFTRGRSQFAERPNRTHSSRFWRLQMSDYDLTPLPRFHGLARNSAAIGTEAKHI